PAPTPTPETDTTPTSDVTPADPTPAPTPTPETDTTPTSDVTPADPTPAPTPTPAPIPAPAPNDSDSNEDGHGRKDQHDGKDEHGHKSEDHDGKDEHGHKSEDHDGKDGHGHKSEDHDGKDEHASAHVDTPVLSTTAHVHVVSDPAAIITDRVGVDSVHTTTHTTVTGGNGSDFGNDSGRLVVHATADQAGDKHGFDIVYDGHVVGHAGAGTTTLDGLDIHDGGKLSFVGANGTNITVDQVTLNGQAINAGSGAKSGGVQLDTGHHSADLHNGSVTYTVNDGNAGAVSHTTTETTHTQSLHLDISGQESQLGGVHVTGLHAGDTISDAGHVWTAGADGAVTITESQLDGMASGNAVHHDFTVTSTQGPDDHIAISGLDHQGGAYHAPTHLVADLNIGATEHDSHASLTYNIEGVPSGCSLVSDSGAHLPGADGSFSLTGGDMHNLKLVMPGDGSVSDFNLTVSATAHDGTSVASASQSLHVGVSEALGSHDGTFDSSGIDLSGHNSHDHGFGHDAMGHDNGETMLFDFGTGHDTIGDHTGNWTDVADAADNHDHGAAVAHGEHGDWTEKTEHHGEHNAQDNNQHKPEDTPVHHQSGGEEHHVNFESIDHAKM
ncbi:MAG: hypothetical protein HY055_17205, partial [Magnetospirillum sp.]|nr:hypothetical protein [Magnetospirillum sp.]